MHINLSEEELDIVVGALEHYFAYARTTSRDGSRYQELADRLKKQVAGNGAQPSAPRKRY